MKPQKPACPESELDQNYYSPYEVIKRVLELHENQASQQKTKIVNRFIMDRRLHVLGRSPEGQDLSNLIEEAIKDTKPGGTITVTTSLLSDEGQSWLVIEVRNSGNGIERTTPDHTAGSFRLLVADTRLDTKFDENFQEPLLRSSSLPEGLRILLVDDHPLNLFYTKHFLRKGSGIIYEADDVHAAIDILSKEQVDLVLTDIHLPDLSGWDLLAHIRAHKSMAHIGVIATTASDEPVTSDGDLSFDGVLVKPFNENDLVRTILETYFSNAG